MRLYLMRHGPAEDTSPSGSDRDRPLSRNGGALVARAAAALAGELSARRLPRPRVVSSPLLRARQTAEILARTLADPREEETELALERGLAPSDEPPVDLALALDRSGEDTLWVSHQPGLERLARLLLAGRPETELLPLARGFRTAMLLALELSPDSSEARLVFALDPSALPTGP